MNAHNFDPTRILNISVREGRMFVDRILLTCGIPSGYSHAVRDSILISQSLGLGGIQALVDAYSTFRMPDFDALEIEDVDDRFLSVDGAGIHAWLLAPTLTDLIVEVTRKKGNVQFQISNVAAPAELLVIAKLCKRYGVRAEVSRQLFDGATLDTVMSFVNTGRPHTLEQADPLLWSALKHGYEVNENLWRAVYSLSNNALAPDSVISRRHAGPVILKDDGTLLGRAPSDDDFDINMLRKSFAQSN